MTTWFISGASSGIGAELARQLARRGDDVAVAARRRDRLEDLAEELADAPGTVTVHEVDVTDHDALEAAMRAADQAHGGLGVVVANAGVGRGSVLGSGNHAANEAVVATNIVGVVSTVEVALALMQPRGTGRIVLVSSVTGVRGLPGTAAVYSASKAAVASLGESLAVQLRGTGVGVTTIFPGWVDTEMTERVRYRIKAGAPRAVAQLLEAVDRGRTSAYVPRWWRPVAGLLRVVPDSLVDRFT